jgi:hypothetical protein
MGLISGFRPGRSTYTCETCGKLTRETGMGESAGANGYGGVCAKCYDEGGWENEHYDDPDHNGVGPSPDNCPTCRDGASGN